jgi:hypothetical protein
MLGVAIAGVILSLTMVRLGAGFAESRRGPAATLHAAVAQCWPAQSARRVLRTATWAPIGLVQPPPSHPFLDDGQAQGGRVPALGRYPQRPAYGRLATNRLLRLPHLARGSLSRTPYVHVRETNAVSSPPCACPRKQAATRFKNAERKCCGTRSAIMGSVTSACR